MKFSEKTMKVLKNYQTINSNLVITPGNQIITRNPDKTIASRFRCEETFEREIPIVSLTEFNNLYNMFKNPEIEFTDRCMTISDEFGKQRILYGIKDAMDYADKVPPELEYTVEFDLSHEILTRLKSAISTNNFGYLSLNSHGGRLSVIAGDINEDTNEFDPDSNLYTFDLSLQTENDFNIVLSAADLVMLVDNYKVGIYYTKQAKLIGFHNAQIDYWVSVQKFSTFSE